MAAAMVTSIVDCPCGKVAHYGAQSTLPGAMRHPLLSVLFGVALSLGAARSAQAQTLPDKQATFGAFASPAALPPGSSSAYGWAGVPEVGAGYRLGVFGLEVDSKVRFDYFALSLALETHARYPVLQSGKWMLAPSLGVGLLGNTGATYIDRENFAYWGARIIPGALLSYRIAETANLIGEVTVPFDVSLSPQGGFRTTPLAGGGAELYLGEDLSAGIVALFGVDSIKEPLGVTRSRFGFNLRVGVGYRFF